jgi:hypothetical protein
VVALFVAMAAVSDRPSLPPDVRVAALVTSAQAFLLAIDRHSSCSFTNTRWKVPLVGHSAIVVGSVFELGVIVFRPGAALLLYAIDFSLLLLHVFWMDQLNHQTISPQPNTASRYWEAVLLIVLVIGNVATMAVGFAVAIVTTIPYTGGVDLGQERYAGYVSTHFQSHVQLQERLS